MVQRILIWVLVLAWMMGASPVLAQGAATPAESSGGKRTASTFENSSAFFIENAGQMQGPALYQAVGAGRTIWLTQSEIWVTVTDLSAQDSFSPPQSTTHIRLAFSGANPAPGIEPFGRLPGTASYFLGSDPARWRPEQSQWLGVRYKNLYPDIDLELRAAAGEILPVLVCRSQCSSRLDRVRLTLEGVQSAAIAGESLAISTGSGEFQLPLLQLENAGAGSLPGPSIQASGAAFEVHYPFKANRSPSTSDNAAPPTDSVFYTALLGGSGYDEGHSIALDAAGHTYIAGHTWSPDFPSGPGDFANPYGGGSLDAFVAILNLDGSAIQQAIYVGGSGDDWAYDLAVVDQGDLYLALETSSVDFPVLGRSIQKQYGGANDAAAIKVSPSRHTLVYSTFLGGSQADGARAIAARLDGSAVLTGYTYSPDFPAPRGSSLNVHHGYTDVFVATIDPAGSSLAYTALIGSPGDEGAEAVSVDAQGAAYVTGWTNSAGFPTTPGAAAPRFNGGYVDGFLFKLDADGQALGYSTFLGGSGDEWPSGLAVQDGHAYAAGYTYSADFPTTGAALSLRPGLAAGCDPYDGCDADTFVVKLNGDGSEYIYAAVFGGAGNDRAARIAIDEAGSVYLTGTTNSADFPATASSNSRYHGFSDVYVTRLDPSGSAIAYSAFLGGEWSEEAYDIALAADGSASITGVTWSPDFPGTTDSSDTTLYESGVAFATRFWMSEDILPPTGDPQGASQLYLPLAFHKR